MKKILAILMSAVLLLGLFAGCGEKAPEATEGTKPATNPVAAGMLVLNVNGAVNVSYDADGLVLNLEGADINGEVLAGEYSDYLGKSVSEVICDLIVNSKMAGFLLPEVSCVVIKQAVGSALPGATFLETIEKDAEAAIASAELTAELVMLTEDNLDEDGYINLESAKGILLASLALDSFDTIDGTVSPIDGMYGFTITAGDLEGDFIVDAVTALVVEGQLEGHSYGEGDLEDPDVVDPTDETYVEETTAPASTEPAVDDTVATEPVVEEEAEA
ncbi:MAG: hypothetical protein IKU07_03620 [Oscillospiraceae bacterium]|nr:hypothetical protein [Oscillospiraceae bacterium]